MIQLEVLRKVRSFRITIASVLAPALLFFFMGISGLLLPDFSEREDSANASQGSAWAAALATGSRSDGVAGETSGSPIDAARELASVQTFGVGPLSPPISTFLVADQHPAFFGPDTYS